MKNFTMIYIKSYLFILVCVLTGAFIHAADAPKADSIVSTDITTAKLSSTRASVSRDSEKNVDLFDKTTIADLRAERDALKKHVEEMEAAIKIIQQQRNQVVGQLLDTQLNLQLTTDALSAARGTPPPANK
jgi:uncharacterized protein YhaN